MTELATLHARMTAPDDTRFTAVFTIGDDGTITRQITTVNGAPSDNKPAVFRHLTETERCINCADRLSAIGFLAGVIAAEGWMVTA